MKLTYVTSGAVLQCPFGAGPSKLIIPDIPSFPKACKNPIANINDNVGGVNISTFGACSCLGNPATFSLTAANMGALTPAPCMPQIVSPWMGAKNNVIVRGAPALLITSKCMCSYGGVISITHDGQIPVEIKEASYGNLVLDGIQETLDILGFIPGWGAIADLANAGIHVARGNYVLAGLSLAAAVPGIGDAAAGVKWASKGVKGYRKCMKMVDLEKKVQEGNHAYKKVLNQGSEIVNRELAFDQNVSDSAKELDKILVGEEPASIPLSIPGHVSVGISVDAPVLSRTFDESEKDLEDHLIDIGSKWMRMPISFAPNPFAVIKHNEQKRAARNLLEESLDISARVSHNVPPSTEIERRYNNMNNKI